MKKPIPRPDQYAKRAAELIKAIDIAEHIVRASQSLPPEVIDAMLRSGRLTKQQLLDPESRFRTASSLRQSEADFFIYWNEASGPDVEQFWIQLMAIGLPFKRKDVLGMILKRGRIRGRTEYDIVIDTIVPAEQTGRISSLDAALLAKYLAEYEARRSS
jgi:hypothetical protein